MGLIIGNCHIVYFIKATIFQMQECLSLRLALFSTQIFSSPYLERRESHGEEVATTKQAQPLWLNHST